MEDLKVSKDDPLNPFNWAKFPRPSIFAKDIRFCPLGWSGKSRDHIQAELRQKRVEDGTDRKLGPLSNKGKAVDQLGRQIVDLAPKTAGAISLVKHTKKPNLAKARI